MRWLKWVAVLLVILTAVFWWLMIEGTAPKTAEDQFDLAAYRALIADDTQNLPTEIRMETIGSDEAPGFAAETGNFSTSFETAYTSLQIIWPDKQVIIGGAIDGDTSAAMEQSPEARMFDPAAYDRMLKAMFAADEVYITHGHPDHVVAVARFPEPALLAPKLRLNKAQLDSLPKFAVDGKLAPEIAGIAPIAADKPRRIAAGIVLIPTAGHSPGSQSFYVRLQDGTEYLLIGDIVWMMSNIDNLKTRPRLLQYLLFEPDEQRDVVLAQVRALHDMQKANPKLVIVPSHDGRYLKSLVTSQKLIDGFQTVTAP